MQDLVSHLSGVLPPLPLLLSAILKLLLILPSFSCFRATPSFPRGGTLGLREL